MVEFELDSSTVARVACAQSFFSGGSGQDDFPGFLDEALSYFQTYVRFFVFFARSTAADKFRTLCAGSTHDRRRQQQQQSREHAITSWLQCYTTCCIAHSCFYRTLGSVIEHRAGPCELLMRLSALSAVCVIDATGTAALCCCCAVLLL